MKEKINYGCLSAQQKEELVLKKLLEIAEDLELNNIKSLTLYSNLKEAGLDSMNLLDFAGNGIEKIYEVEFPDQEVYRSAKTARDFIDAALKLKK